VLGKRGVQTRLAGRVAVREDNAAGALEVMSRFAIEPRWLLHLPPTMAPTATTRTATCSSTRTPPSTSTGAAACSS
jgi:protein phosphatase